MVNCETVLQRLSDFMDNEAGPELRAEIAAHLKACDRCSVLHDTLRQTLLIVADDRVFEVPLGYSQRLHDFIDRHL